MKSLQRTGKHFKGFTTGLDLHQSFIEFVVLDAKGNDARDGRIPASEKALEKLLLEWKAKGHVQVAFEACGCFAWVFDLAVKLLGREQVHPAHPGKLRVVAQSSEKNDHNDAWWLAYLQYERRLPKAFVAEGTLLELRVAGRQLRKWTDRRSDLIREVRSILAQLGKKLPKGWHTSPEKRAVTKAVIDAVEGVRGEALQDLYEAIEGLSEKVSKWRKKAADLCLAFPEARVIMEEMPGMKSVVSGLIIGELGSPKRFKSAKCYAKATGLTPGYRKSGGKTVVLPITREGSPLARWAFTRAVLACLRCKKGPGLAVKTWVMKQVARQKIKKKVIVAAARKLAEGVWRLLSWGEAFDLKRAFPA